MDKQIAPRYNESDYSNRPNYRATGSITVSYTSTDGSTKTGTALKREGLNRYDNIWAEIVAKNNSKQIDTKALVFNWTLPIDYAGNLKVTGFTFDLKDNPYSVELDASPTLTLNPTDKLSALGINNAYTEIIRGTGVSELDGFRCLIIPTRDSEWLSDEARETGVMNGEIGHLQSAYATFGASVERQKIYIRTVGDSEKLECLIPLPWDLYSVLHIHSKMKVDAGDTVDHSDPTTDALPYAIHEKGGMSVSIFNNKPSGEPYEADTETVIYKDAAGKEYYALGNEDDAILTYNDVWKHFAGDGSEAGIDPVGYEEYITANENVPLTLGYTAKPKNNDNKPYLYANSFTWVSSDTDVATIDAKTGVITPLTPGTVEFYLVNDNGGTPVAVKSAALTISESKDLYLYVPATSGKVTTRQGLPATVIFATNLTGRNAEASGNNKEETVYTVQLMKGDTEVGSYTVTGTPDKPVSSCIIPAEAMKETGDYTATVSAAYVGKGDTHEGAETFSDSAMITVKPKPASIELTPPSNEKTGLPYVLDSTAPKATWNITATGNGAKWKYEIVTSDGTVVEQKSGNGAENGSYAFPKTKDKLKEVYTITVYATNDETEDGWTAATSRIYVYNSEALDILVHKSNHLTQEDSVDENGKPLDKLELNNRRWLESHLSDDGKTLDFAGMDLSFEELQQDVNLSAVVSLNYGNYEWGNLSDMIRWDAVNTDGDEPNPDGGVFYYHHPDGVYFSNGTYGSGTYFPRSEFLEQGLRDGTVNITATHAATGQKTTVQVDVDRLEDVFYLFRLRRVNADGSISAGVTEVIYRDATNHEQHTVRSNDKGQMALYEPLGIDTDYPIYLSSKEGSLAYFGSIEPDELLSGEVDDVQGETYPVNICELYRPDQVTLRIFDPDGNPLKNKELVLRGGAYYNDQYQARADIFNEVSLTESQTGNIGDENDSNGLKDIDVKTNENGEINLSFNLGQVADGNVDVTKPIQYVFELRTEEKNSKGKPVYRPAIVQVNPLTGRSTNVLLFSYNGSNVYLNSQGGKLNLTTASGRNAAPYVNALTLHRSAIRSTSLLDSIKATKNSGGTRLQTYSGLPDERVEELPLTGNAGAKLGPNEQYPETVLEYETVMRGMESLIEIRENGQAAIVEKERDTYTQYFYDHGTGDTLGKGYTVKEGQQVSRLWVYPFSTVPIMTTVLQLDEAGFGLDEKGGATEHTWLEKYHSTLADVHLKHNRTNECDLRFDYRIVNSVGAMVPTESRRATGQIARLVNALETDMNGFSLEKLLGKDSKVGKYFSKVIDQIIRQTVGYSIKPYYAATADPTVYYVYLKVDPSLFQQMLSQSLGISFVDLAKDELTKVVLKALGHENTTYDYEEMERRLTDRIKDASKFGINPSFSDYEDLFSHVEMPKDAQGDEWDLDSFARYMDAMAYRHEGALLARAEYDLKNQQWNMFYMDGVVNSMLQLGYTQGINVIPGFVVNVGGQVGIDKMYKAKNVYQDSDIRRYDMVRQFSIGGGIELAGGLGAEAGIFSVFFGPYGIIKYSSNNATLTSTLHNEASDKVEVQTTHGNKHSLYGQAGLKFEVSAWIFSESIDLISFNFKIKEWSDDSYDTLRKLWAHKAKLTMADSGQPVEYQVSGSDRQDDGEMMIKLTNKKLNAPTGELQAGKDLYQTYGTDANVTVSDVSDDGKYVFYIDDCTASWADADGRTKGSLIGRLSRTGGKNNARGDFGHFNLDASGKGNDLFAVWSTQTQDFATKTGEGKQAELSLSDAAAMMNSGEITVAQYDGEKWISKNLTDNTVPDLMPKVTSSGKKAAVIWLSGSSSNTGSVNSVTKLGNFDVDNKIQFSRFDGTGWSDTQTLVNLAGEGQVTGLDTAMLNDGTVIAAYAVNHDDKEDSTGQEIYYAIIPADSDQAPKTFRATEDTQFDAHPQLTVVNNGKEAVLAWYTEVQNTRTVAAMNGIEGATETLSSSNPSIRLLGINAGGTLDTRLPECIQSENVPVTQNFRMDGDSLSGLTIAWLVNESAGNVDDIEEAAIYRSALYGVQLYADDSRCVASMPQRLLQTKENITGSDFYMNVDGKDVTAVISEADYTSKEYETINVKALDGEGQETDDTLQIPKLYHRTEKKTGSFTNTLNVSDIRYNADLAAPDTTLPVSFTVQNNGVDKITELKLNDAAQSGVILYPGEAATVRTGKTFGATITDYPYEITAEEFTGISGTIPFSKPAVQITGMRVTSPGDKPLDEDTALTEVNNEGNRTVTVTLENKNSSFIPLVGSDKTLTVQLFADMEGEQKLSDPVTVSSEDYSLLDSGALTVRLDTNVKKVLDALSDNSAAENELEIPETGLPVFAMASVSDGSRVISTAVNMTTLTLLSPADENGKPGVTVSVSDWSREKESGDVNTLLRFDNSSLYEKKEPTARMTVYDINNLPVAVTHVRAEDLAGESSLYKTLLIEMPDNIEAAYVDVELVNDLTLPDAPKVSGHSFNGWYSDKSHDSLFDATNLPVDNVIYAAWDQVAGFTEPSAKTLTYSGQAQELVTAGTAEGGTMQYALGKDAVTAPDAKAYKTGIPTGTNAGTYYVWYKVVGDGKHTDVAPACVEVTIGKRSATATSKDQTITYGQAISQNASEYEVTGLAEGDTATVELSLANNTKQINIAVTIKHGETDVTANYDIQKTLGNLTVNPKELTVKADAVSKTEGEADPSFTYKVEGLVGDDKQADVLVGTLTRDAGETARTYAIKQGTLKLTEKYADCYTIKYTGAELTIKAKPTPAPTATPTVQPTTTPTAQPSSSATPAPEQQTKINTLNINSGFEVSQKGSKIYIKWGKVDGADSYDVYVAYCGTKFSKASTCSTAGTKAVVTKLGKKKINLKKNFKVYVVAKNKKEKLARTITGHIVGRKNRKYTNAKSIKLTKDTISLGSGKTEQIKAKTILANSKKKQLSDAHATEFRYATSDSSIATVSKKGVVKGVGKGTCSVYVYSRNGYAKKIKVTVK